MKKTLPIAAILFVAFSYPIYPATKVCGTIKRAVDWTRKGSPYIVTNDILVTAKSRLAIEAGTVVQFEPPQPCEEEFPQEDWADSQFTSIKVEGFLFIHGKEHRPVILQNTGAKSGVGWDGIRIKKGTKISLKFQFAIFSGANKAIQVEDSEFSISHCVFKRNNTGIALKDYGNVWIQNNIFIENTSAGIWIMGANPIILNNIITDNQNYGIWADSRQGIKVEYNGFWNNLEGHCHRCPKGLLEITSEEGKSAQDEWGNLIAPPVFKGSEDERILIRQDMEVDTDPAEVKDQHMAQVYKQLQKHLKEKQRPKNFSPLGRGHYLLSKYSPYIDAGNPGSQFKDRDKSINDLGIHGGPLD